MLILRKIRDASEIILNKMFFYFTLNLYRDIYRDYLGIRNAQSKGLFWDNLGWPTGIVTGIWLRSWVGRDFLCDFVKGKMRSNNKSPFSLSLSLQRAKTTFLPKNILLILPVSDTISVVNGCNAAAVISRDKKHGILNHAPENLIAYFDIYTKKKSFINWSIIDYVSFIILCVRENLEIKF